MLVRSEWKWNNKKKIVENKNSYGYYIPIKSTLAKLLQNSNFRKFWSDEAKRPDIGNIASAHTVMINNPNAWKLVLYHDDINVTNPLSNKSHKLSLFYYSFSFLPSSQLDSIFLLAVAKTEAIHSSPQSLDALLTPFVEEMKVFGNEGVEFGNDFVHIALTSVVADTPAANYLGGFKEGVGWAKRKCRSCMGTYEEIQEKFFEEEFEMRELPKHLIYCSEIKKSETKGEEKSLSVEYGINFLSKLNEVPGFDLTKMFPQDIMHVELEGSLAREIYLFLTDVIKIQKLLTLQDINTRLVSFPLGHLNEKDRPSPLKENQFNGSSNKIKQSATQCWMFARMIPFIFEDILDLDNLKHQSLLLHLELVHLVFLPKFNMALTSYLKSLINEYLQAFIQAYPSEPITPKQHYLVHLPSQIIRYGAPKDVWCLRFEAKHREFKKFAVKSNFKNTPLTISKRYQKLFSLQHTSLFQARFEVGPKAQVLFPSPDHAFVSSFIQGGSSRDLWTLNWIKSTFHLLPGAIVNFKTCYFGEVVKIFQFQSSQIFIQVAVLEVGEFDFKFLTFPILQKTSTILIPVSEIEGVSNCWIDSKGNKQISNKFLHPLNFENKNLVKQ